MKVRATALIADDEPLLRNALRRQLAIVWPELTIVAEARNGREAVSLFDERHPDICFLDVHMPGLSGVDAAHHIGRRAHVVFVTAYDHYAVQAFAQGALDYLLKPVELARLVETVGRLRERLQSSKPATNTEQLLQQLSEQLATLQAGASMPERSQSMHRRSRSHTRRAAFRAPKSSNSTARRQASRSMPSARAGTLPHVWRPAPQTWRAGRRAVNRSLGTAR